MTSPRTLLVVEDDDATREGLVELFDTLGYAAHGVPNGREALVYLDDHPQPCAILLDVMMPVMGGVEFRERQLQDQRFAQVPVIVVSAVEAQVAASLRATAYVRKPLDIPRLIEVVETHCA